MRRAYSGNISQRRRMARLLVPLAIVVFMVVGRGDEAICYLSFS